MCKTPLPEYLQKFDDKIIELRELVTEIKDYVEEHSINFSDEDFIIHVQYALAMRIENRGKDDDDC